VVSTQEAAAFFDGVSVYQREYGEYNNYGSLGEIITFPSRKQSALDRVKRIPFEDPKDRDRMLELMGRVTASNASAPGKLAIVVEVVADIDGKKGVSRAEAQLLFDRIDAYHREKGHNNNYHSLPNDVVSHARLAGLGPVQAMLYRIKNFFTPIK
jgi:hypothetical protein